MNDTIGIMAGLRSKLIRVTIDFLINFFYMAVFLGLFTWYRRLILAEYHITYLHYGITLIEALVLAKLIMLGDAVGLGRKLEDRPLAVLTLYKVVVFTLFVVAFGVFEHELDGWVHGRGLTYGLVALLRQGWDKLLAQTLLTFTAFIPFFAMRELSRALGEGRVSALFFCGRAREKETYR